MESIFGTTVSKGRIVPPPRPTKGSGVKTSDASSEGDEAESGPKNLSTNISLLKSVFTILLAPSLFLLKNLSTTDLRPRSCDPFENIA